MSREINEATQQNAIYQEIIRQTAKFQGLESKALDTTKGKMQSLDAQTSALYKTIGELLNPAVSDAVTGLTELATLGTETLDAIKNQYTWYEKLAISVGSFMSLAIPGMSIYTKIMLDAQNKASEYANKQDDANKAIEDSGQVAEVSTNKWVAWINTLSDADKAIASADMWKQIFEREPAMLDEMHRDYAEFLDEEANQADEQSDYLMKLKFDELSASTKAYTDYHRNIKQQHDRWTQDARTSSKHVAHGLIDVFTGMELKSRDVWIRMAKHFSSLFIDEVLKSVSSIFVPKFISILAAIFDTRANDMMAIGQGSDFGRFFNDGVISQVNPEAMSEIFNKAMNFEDSEWRSTMTGGFA